MKKIEEINELLLKSYKETEQALGIKIRNGQSMEGIRKALGWVLI